MLKKILFVLFFFQLTMAGALFAAPLNKGAEVTSCKFHSLSFKSEAHTSLLFLIHEDVMDDTPNPGNNLAGHSKAFILHSRTNYSTPLLPGRQLIQFCIPAPAQQEHPNNSVRAAVLPAYYNFLFRLSPF